MKVRLVLNLDEHDRFVVAKYFSEAAPAQSADRARTRATREQCRRFVRGALRSALKEQAAALRGRSRAHEQKLREGFVAPDETLRPTPESQPSLQW